MGERGYRIGAFAFDPASGELRPFEPEPGLAPKRLPPQPARLLALLAEAGGEVVTRETIRAAVWPDVEVDFDSSLHFCIRQIRAALGDSASDPVYVETLPRRGYRLMGVDAAASDPTGPASPAGRPSLRRAGIAALLLVFGAGAAYLGLRSGPRLSTPVAAQASVSVGVMPFRAPEGWDGGNAAEVASIADGVLEALVVAGGQRLRVVGPSNTAPYDGPDRALQELAAAMELDYVVNGRFVRDDDGSRMLAELVRSSDGAHVWVRRYEDFEDGDAIADEISRAVLDRLGLVSP